MWLNYVKESPKLFYEFVSDLILVRFIKWIFTNKIAFIVTVIIIAIGYTQGKEVLEWYKEEYERANAEKVEEDLGPGMEFTMIEQGLYTMTGQIQQGDCNRIVKDFPSTTHFTVILESPGGNLAEGSCLASHLKLRDVNTVVRNTPVYNELNKIIYEPGTVGGEENKDNRVICASACGLLFLAGDSRYLIGDVWLGIHGPSTPPGAGPMTPQQAESGMLQTASQLLDLLEGLGVSDPETRRLFIQIPGHTMYWVKPSEFHLRKGLVTLATHYRNFWGLTASNHAETM